MIETKAFQLVTAPLILMTLIGCDNKQPETPLSENISEVTKVTLAVMESEPLQLSITAEGMVTTAGWTNPTLDPFVYVAPPPDGIYDFTFNAVPPSDTGAQVMTPITASHIVKPMPANLKGVRIHAAQNQVTEHIIVALPEGG